MSCSKTVPLALSFVGSPFANLSKNNYRIVSRARFELRSWFYRVEWDPPVGGRGMVRMIFPFAIVVERIDCRFILVQIMADKLLVKPESRCNAEKKKANKRERCMHLDGG